ncbi:DNA-directed RNA polymerase [Thecaphora frezii]
MYPRQVALLRRAPLAAISSAAGPSSLGLAPLSSRSTAWQAQRSAFSSKSPNRQASPAPNETSATSPASATSSHPNDGQPLHPHARKDRRTHFMPYAYGSGSPLTKLPTPLPPDVAERQAELRKQLTPRGNSRLSDHDFSGLSFGDLSGLTMTNVDETFYPASKSVESIGILKACLGTGLITRAHKLFSDFRNQAQARAREAWEYRNRSLLSDAAASGSSRPSTASVVHDYESPLEIWTYNAMLQAYLRKAYTSESLEGTSEWLSRAWDLWRDMEQGGEPVSPAGPPSSDLRPNASTFAIMARGIVGLQRGGRYPSSAPPLETLISAAKRSGTSFEAVLTSPIFNPEEAVDLSSFGQNKPKEGEPDAMLVLRVLSAAASEVGDAAVVHELDSVQGILDGANATGEASSSDSSLVNPLEGVPELLPVKTTSKASRRGGESESAEGEMPFNLASLKDNLSAVHEARMNFRDPYERQKWLEHSALDAARRRLEHSAAQMEELGLQTTGALQSKQLQSWMWEWFNKLQTRLQEDIKRVQQVEDGASKRSATAMEVQILPFLRLLPVNKLALITILELMRMAGSTGGVESGMKTARALLQVGRAIELEYHAEVVRKNPQIFQNAHIAQAVLKKRGLIDMAARREIKAWQKQMEDGGAISSIPRWTQTVRARVGSYVVQHLLQVATVNRKATDRDGVVWEEEQPAFYSAYQYLGGKKLGVIKLNSVVAKRLDKDSVQETLHPRHLPMLVPPKPWTTHDAGGYYSVRQSAMRFKDSAEQGSYLRAAAESGNLDTVLAALDVLGQTSWKVNRPVFDVMVEVWNSGSSIADMPPLEMETPEPTKPTNYDQDIQARAVYLQRLKQWNSQRAAIHSQRCDVNYKLEIARAFLGETFYFPHNMDFRGRAYPMPPHLNHIGNDLCRGLLKFAETKPLGKAGLRWLRIHLANVYGYDKASFAEREQFAIDHEADIRDSVNNPLNGKRWWLKADDPWQCLATCIELTAALDHPEGPEAFESGLPVHQDGTCNGLQHYAALGGDLQGAKQVNLSGGDRPADVYTGVAELAIQVINDDAAKGDRLAQLLQGKITRKVVKQTVMTTVYGVTFIGAKNQVMRQLADRGDVPAEDLFTAASYMAKVIMSCIGDLFHGAQQIQDWLSASAKMIAKSIPPARIEEALRPYQPIESTAKRAEAKGFSRDPARADRIVKEQMTSVIWTTALGLPVVQPYRKVKKRQVSTAMQSIFIQDPLSASEVSPGKQASAFPPNFIHSLDATHMFLTALECHAAGLTFASVHDSYWTHAADIDTMSDLIRETFIRLHSQDILQKLRDEFLQRYAGYKVPVVSLQTSALRQKKSAKKDDEESDTVLVLPEAQVAKLEGQDREVLVEQAVSRRRSAAADEDDEEGFEDDAAQANLASRGESDVAPEDADFAESVDVGEDSVSTKAKRGRQPKTELGSPEERLKAKFVDLEAILPPIPKKGSFDVNEIKRSLYFFS